MKRRKGGSALAIIHLIDSDILESITPQCIKPLKSFPSPLPRILPVRAFSCKNYL